MKSFVTDLTVFWKAYNIQLIISAGILITYLIIKSVTLRFVKAHSQKFEINPIRLRYTIKLINILLIIVFVAVLGVVWEVSIQGLSVYFASILTVVGVALFAHWSMLSNITASLILFFSVPYRIGNTIKIIDGDNSVEGVITDISLYYTQIRNEEGELFAYPNNLMLQKPIKQVK